MRLAVSTATVHLSVTGDNLGLVVVIERSNRRGPAQDGGLEVLFYSFNQSYS